MGISSGDNLLTALVAGCTSSGLAAFITFPLDFFKTRQQLSCEVLRREYKIEASVTSLSQLMTGSSALVAGSMIKNFCRILSYQWTSDFMAIDTHDNKKKTSAPRVVIAAAMTGCMESLWIVPFERIKTTMIENRLLVGEIRGNPNPSMDITRGVYSKIEMNALGGRAYLLQHAYYTTEVLSFVKNGKVPLTFNQSQVDASQAQIDALKKEFNKAPALTFVRSILQMYALEGIHAFTAGTMITLVRQCATSAAWFSTYSATRQFFDPHNSTEESRWFSPLIGKSEKTFLYLVSALATVAITQPIDVVKSQIQLKNGRLLYKDSLTAAYQLVARRGFLLLYSGFLPRFFKIAAHGSLTALLYDYAEKAFSDVNERFVFTD